jgi:hypothetical protein
MWAEIYENSEPLQSTTVFWLFCYLVDHDLWERPLLGPHYRKCTWMGLKSMRRWGLMRNFSQEKTDFILSGLFGGASPSTGISPTACGAWDHRQQSTNEGGAGKPVQKDCVCCPATFRPGQSHWYCCCSWGHRYVHVWCACQCVKKWKKR